MRNELLGLVIISLVLVIGNQTFGTNVDCPENYYGNDSGVFDLLDRSWCGNLVPLD